MAKCVVVWDLKRNVIAAAGADEATLDLIKRIGFFECEPEFSGNYVSYSHPDGVHVGSQRYGNLIFTVIGALDINSYMTLDVVYDINEFTVFREHALSVDLCKSSDFSEEVKQRIRKTLDKILKHSIERAKTKQNAKAKKAQVPAVICAPGTGKCFSRIDFVITTSGIISNFLLSAHCLNPDALLNFVPHCPIISVGACVTSIYGISLFCYHRPHLRYLRTLPRIGTAGVMASFFTCGTQLCMLGFGHLFSEYKKIRIAAGLFVSASFLIAGCAYLAYVDKLTYYIDTLSEEENE